MSPGFRFTERRFEKPRQLLPAALGRQGGRWADLGCGDGVFTAVLYQLLGPTSEIHAVDRDARALARLRRSFHASFPEASVQVMQADFRRPLDLPPLDGILMANSLHFIPDRERVEVLLPIVSHLVPGGRLVVVEYNARRGNFAVPHPLDPNGFLALAEQVGLEHGAISARTPSRFMGEMYTGTAEAPHKMEGNLARS